jgi:hypothetical protein
MQRNQHNNRQNRAASRLEQLLELDRDHSGNQTVDGFMIAGVVRKLW